MTASARRKSRLPIKPSILNSASQSERMRMSASTFSLTFGSSAAVSWGVASFSLTLSCCPALASMPIRPPFVCALFHIALPSGPFALASAAALALAAAIASHSLLSSHCEMPSALRSRYIRGIGTGEPLMLERRCPFVFRGIGLGAGGGGSAAARAAKKPAGLSSEILLERPKLGGDRGGGALREEKGCLALSERADVGPSPGKPFVESNFLVACLALCEAKGLPGLRALREAAPRRAKQPLPSLRAP